MTLALATVISLISALALGAVAIWRRKHFLSCGAQVLILLTLLGVITATHDTAIRLTLTIVSSFVIVAYWRQGRVTSAAGLIAWTTGFIVVLWYPPTWMLSMVFLLGWAHFVGDLDSDAPFPAPPHTRDITDMLPAAVIILLGATLIDAEPRIAALVVFGALGFIVNDVLASDLGPLLPGSARLFPQPAAVPHGTPGAISYSGTIVGLLGSVSAGLCASALLRSYTMGIAIFLGGSIGAFVDTALGRTCLRNAVRRGREVINSVACISAVISCLLIAFAAS